MKIKNTFMIAISFSVMVLLSCGKFLDAKPENTLAYPNTLKDLRALLDNEDFINKVYPAIMGIASDEFFITHKGFSAIPAWYSDTYVWDDKGLDYGSYLKPYQVISIANVVLEGLERIDEKNEQLKRTLEGEALFLRGWMFYNLAQIYCQPYSIREQNQGLGLVLRMDSDSEVNIGRATLKDTYQQLFKDLNRALELLPNESDFLTRPSKQVCLAALSRIYLSIDDYDNAEKMVDQLLSKRNSLLDFNDLDSKLKYPISIKNNSELLYSGQTGSTKHFIINANTYIDSNLYNLYEENDLRKKFYYESGLEGMKFRGYYHGELADYSAVLAMDEVYLTKAECLVRRGVINESLKILNTLRRHRFEPVYFKPVTILEQEGLLVFILDERRRQLVCRGTRWGDLRRLNRDVRFRKTLRRILHDSMGNKEYTLEPNELRYTFLIPEEAVEVGGYVQNPR